MAVTRKFLDWQRPALVSAAAWLAEKYGKTKGAGNLALDLREVIVVVPGGRAGRRLLELLVERAEAANLVLLPPVIITEGGLPELLYTPQRPFASELTQRLAWAEALRKTPPNLLKRVIQYPPSKHDFARWLELAEMVRRLHTELAADGLHFGHAAGARRHSVTSQELVPPGELRRWEALRQVQEEYLRRLDSLHQWDIQTARLVGIEKKEFHSERDIVLLGTVDLNRALRQILEQVADRVTALIHAPPEWNDRFDPLGCLIPAEWKNARLAIDDAQVERVDGPAEQADAVTRWMASLGGKYRADQIVVGVPDETLVPQLERQLGQCGVTTRWVEGKRIAESAPYKLLAAAGRFASGRRFADLAALARHPDLEDWLGSRLQESLRKQNLPDMHRQRRAGDIQTALDRFYSEQFAARLDPSRLAEIEHDWPAIHALVQAIDGWLLPLAHPKQRLVAWADGLRRVLQAIYGEFRLNPEDARQRYLLKTCEHLDDALESLALVPPELDCEVALDDAMRLVLGPLASAAVPPLPDPAAVELLGWLELTLDDASALAVTSVNEGLVPKSTSGDAFLPNELRSQLGLLSNDRRYARDAYALSVLLATRPQLRLIVGHRDAEGNPLIPSRLLFATEEQAACARALKLFEKLEEAPPRRSLLGAGRQPPAVSAFLVPEPAKPHQPPVSIAVTQFRAYLACKYRFYLGQVLRLKSLSDQAGELGADAFGSLLHEVLQHFGQDEQARDSARAGEIFDFLANQLSEIAAVRYGRDSGRAALRFQVEQARARLQNFSQWQAQQIEDGWKVVYCEDPNVELECDFPTGDIPMKIHGRIDRIDYHDRDKIFRVLDYKTADTAKEPRETHLKNDQWIDLQLPLYRYLVKAVEFAAGTPPAGNVQLGYINLPKDQASTGCCIANWTPDALQQADEAARGVIHGISRGDFWPLQEEPPAFSEIYAAICQDHRIGKRPSLQEEDAAS